MQRLLRSGISIHSLGLKLKTAQIHLLTVDANNCTPTSSLVSLRLGPVNALKLAGLVLTQLREVLVVLGMRCQSKVCNSVVAAIPIDMVNACRWPLAINMNPRDAVDSVSMPKHRYRQVSVSMISTGRGSRDRCLAPGDAIGQAPGVGVVVKQLFNEGLAQCRINFAHAASLLDVVLGSDASCLNRMGRCAIVRGL